MCAVPDYSGNILVAGERQVSVYSGSGERLFSFETKSSITGLVVAGSKLLLAAEGGALDVWDLRASLSADALRCVATIPTKQPVFAVATLLDGRVCTGSQRRVLVWRMPSPTAGLVPTDSAAALERKTDVREAQCQVRSPR